MFKKNLFIIILLIAIKTNAQEWKKHYNNQENFNVEYPNNWTISKSNEITNQAFFVHEPFQEDLTVLSNVQIRISKNFKIPLNIRTELKEVEWKKSQTYTNLNIISKQKNTFLGQEAYTYICEATAQENDIKWIQIITIHKSKYFEISATTSKEKFTLHKEIFDRIIQSITLNN